MLKTISAEYEHDGKRYRRQMDDERWRWWTDDQTWCLCTPKKERKMNDLLCHPESRTPEKRLINIVEDIGYGAAMQLISRKWHDKDPVGALKVGNTCGMEEVNLLIHRGEIAGISTDDESLRMWWHDEPSCEGTLALKCEIWKGKLEDIMKTRDDWYSGIGTTTCRALLLNQVAELLPVHYHDDFLKIMKSPEDSAAKAFTNAFVAIAEQYEYAMKQLEAQLSEPSKEMKFVEEEEDNYCSDPLLVLSSEELELVNDPEKMAKTIVRIGQSVIEMDKVLDIVIRTGGGSNES